MRAFYFAVRLFSFLNISLWSTTIPSALMLCAFEWTLEDNFHFWCNWVIDYAAEIWECKPASPLMLWLNNVVCYVAAN